MTAPIFSKRFCRCTLFSLMMTVLAGCGSSHSLDQPKAQDACKTFLETWKEGKKPSDLQPAIIGADEAWAAGQKLVSFEILSGEHHDQINLSIPVKLTLKDANGQESVLQMTYIVTTSPKVTVFRAF